MGRVATLFASGACLFLIGVGPAFGQVTTSQAPVRSQVSDSVRIRLAQIVLSKLVTADAEITPGGQAQIDALVAAAAERIVADGPSEERIRTAEAAVGRLADELVREGQTRDGVVIARGTVRRATQGVCPIYPFC